MNADRLLAHFDTLVDTPGAVPRLRRFILDLAVRGKLVPQDPNDEPALALLSRIASEKRRLADAGEIRRQKPRWEASSKVDMPFSLPADWAWSRAAKIGVLNPRNSAPDDSQASFVPMAMIASEYGVPHRHEVRRWAEIKSGYTHFAEGDVGVAKITPCFENGKSTIFRNLAGGMGSGTTELHVVRPLFVDPRYVILFFKSSYFIEPGIPKMTGTAGQKRVPATYWANAPFPLPPLAEQHRIVAKVDELMTLCDQMEDARQHREEARDLFTATSLARLSAPDRPAFRAHAVFTINNLDRLTARSEQISALRRTIIDIAVRGRLVPQDPTDEPASELLRRTLATDMRGKGITKIGPSVKGIGDHPELNGWAVAPLGSLLVFHYGKGMSAKERLKEGPVPVFGSNGIVGFCENSLTDESTIIVGRKGSAGALNLCDGPSWTTDVAYYVECPSCFCFDIRFLFIQLQALDLGSLGKGVKPGLSRNDAYGLSLGVPPLEEQRRIVDRVETMMALCDRLEARLAAGEEARLRVLDAMLHAALETDAGGRDAAGINGRAA